MKKFKQKKCTAFVLALAMMLTLFPSMAFVVNASSGNSVAQIGEQEYSSLSDAVSAAGQNGVGTEILLLDNVTDCPTILISGKEITLDLNGYEIGFSTNSRFNVMGGTLNLTGEGKIYEQNPFYAPVLMYGSTDSSAENYSVVNVGSGVTLQGWAGLFITHSSGNADYGIVANVYGTLISVKDTEGAGGHALYVNGQVANTEGSVPKITLDGATLNTELGNGMYLAGYAETVIKNSTITSDAAGGTGIEIRAGKLTISNSTITGGSGDYEGAPNGNGSTSYNVALAVAQHTTKLPLDITVESGTLTGGAAFVQANPQGNDDAAVEKVQIELLNGTFNGMVYSENKTGFISGGTYSEAIDSDYVFHNLSTETDADGNTVIKNLQDVYLNGTKGNDANSGEDAANAVKSLETAAKLVASDGTIYVTGNVTVNSELSVSGVNIKRADSYLGTLINVSGSSGKLTLTDVNIDGSKVEGTTGDLVFITGGATLNIEGNTHLTNNNYTAVYVNVDSFMNMSGGAISNNNCKYSGGGIFNCGTTVISGGEIYENSSETMGGGIDSERGTVILTGDAKIRDNTALSGGGISTVGSAKTVLSGASITGNYASGNGGGVLVYGFTNYENEPAVFEMTSGSITGNSSDSTGAGIFGYYYNYETIIRISGGTISGNTSTVEEMGNAIAMYGVNGSTAYSRLELSGSPTISGDVFFQNDYPDGYVINVTGEFNPTSPVAISRSNDEYGIAAVEYAAGITPKAGDFTSDYIFEALVIDGQTIKWADAGIIYFYADADKTEEYTDFRQGVAKGEKIDPANTPVLTKEGYTFKGWVNQRTQTLWNFDTDTVENNLIYLIASWNLNAPTVSVTADSLSTHIGSNVTLTAAASHALNSVTYTYQWYKDGALLDGETSSTLTVSEGGSYTVKIKASDGQLLSAEVESAASEVTITGHNYVDAVTPPTCTEQGYTTHTCSICQDSYVDTYVGETGHSYGEWEVTKPATETEKGEKQRVCSECRDIDTEEIPALGHTHNYGSEWKYDETNHWNECACGDKANEAAHTFEWVIDKDATATEPGSKHEECSVCGYEKDAVEIPAEKPSESSGGSSSTTNPQTGDNDALGICIALLLTGVLGLGGTVLFERKRKA